MPLVRLLILPDPANVFAPSDNAILLPLSLPEAPIGILPTTSPPARSTAEVDMSAFDEDMAASSSSLSSILKRGRNSPAKGPIVGTKVRILSLRMRAFLPFSMGFLKAFFYRGVRKIQISPLFAPCSIRFFGAWCWGGRLRPQPVPPNAPSAADSSEFSVSFSPNTPTDGVSVAGSSDPSTSTSMGR